MLPIYTMNEEDEQKGGIKIVDRRRFDASGNDKEGVLSSAHPQHDSEREQRKGFYPKIEEVSAVKNDTTEQNFVTHESPEVPESDISFSSLVMSLATQTLMQLGEMSAPEGVSVPVDVEGARQSIEVLNMLSIKTKNNLTKEEAQLLEEVLHNLRVGFVRAAKSAGVK